MLDKAIEKIISEASEADIVEMIVATFKFCNEYNDVNNYILAFDMLKKFNDYLEESEKQ